MILSFTAIDNTAQIRDFFCQLTELEDALDIMSSIASQGDKLIRAYVIEEKSSLQLPIEVFDGQPFSGHIKQLEEQWQAILKTPVQPKEANNTSWYLELTRQRVKLYKDRIEQLTQIIGQLEILCQQTEQWVYSEQLQTKLINRYSTLLTQYRQYMDQALIGQKQVLKKLSQLEHC